MLVARRFIILLDFSILILFILAKATPSPLVKRWKLVFEGKQKNTNIHILLSKEWRNMG
jgi:hypothetical protein